VEVAFLLRRNFIAELTAGIDHGRIGKGSHAAWRHLNVMSSFRNESENNILLALVV